MSARDESGFSLIEVVVASMVLLIGVLGVMTLVDGANKTTYSTKAREQGVALQREIIETARSIPFDQLLPTTAVSKVQQANPALADSNTAAAGWTIERRGFTYSVTLGVCSVDDPSDGSGTHDPAMFCPPGNTTTTAAQCRTWLGINGSVQGTAAAATAGAAVGTCGIDLNLDGTVDNLVQADLGLCLLGICLGATNTDKNPDDYKRIVSLVRWNRGSGGKYALQSGTVPNPGQAAAPAITSITSPLLTITSSATATLPFAVITSRSAATVGWYLDGTAQNATTGQVAPIGAALAWAFNWNIGTVNTTAGGSPGASEALDGSYVVGAKAFDTYGAFGQTRAVTVKLNRRAPYKVTGFLGGRNGTSVEFEWNPNKERDLQGYRVYRGTTSSSAIVCDLTRETFCRDTNPPAAATLNYYMVAVDKDASGSVREGDNQASISVSSTNTAPQPSGSVTKCPVAADGSVTVKWTASPVLPLIGVPVAFYRIYRDGTGYLDRIDRTGSGSDLTSVDRNTGGTSHTYSVSAVGSQLAESSLTAATSASSC